VAPHDLESATRRRRWTARALGALAVVAVALGCVAGPAGAEPQLCNGRPGGRANVCINITSTGNGNFYNVHIGIDVHMSGADARAIINQPGDPFRVRLMGSDSGSDDDFLGIVPLTTIGASDEFGLGADFDRGASRWDLDEDNNLFDDVDDVYAEITLVDSDRGTMVTFRSDIIHNVF
jgi:hypothetical protein